MTKEEICEQLFEKVVKENIKFNVELPGKESAILRTYHDASGQRQCYMTVYGYGDLEKHLERKNYGIYEIRRDLSFINPSDIGKQDAILFTFNLKSALMSLKPHDGRALSIGSSNIRIGELNFTFRTNIL